MSFDHWSLISCNISWKWPPTQAFWGPRAPLPALLAFGKRRPHMAHPFEASKDRNSAERAVFALDVAVPDHAQRGTLDLWSAETNQWSLVNRKAVVIFDQWSGLDDQNHLWSVISCHIGEKPVVFGQSKIGDLCSAIRGQCSGTLISNLRWDQDGISDQRKLSDVWSSKINDLWSARSLTSCLIGEKSGTLA